MDQVQSVCIVLYWHPTPVTQGLTSATAHRLPKPLTDCIQTEELPSHRSFLISLATTRSDVTQYNPLITLSASPYQNSLHLYLCPALLAQRRAFQLP